ncbi:hypothetical protein TanjilG_30829 [Lupinus angustifolius]|uniref:Sodium/calcium exchanger membrane region domain-containing protein n=1 Tax=Lupinus angustifolius TaxID=3871 RepID=A0A1J7HQV1_LUPAN|nr:hypothetical protein TanjilG_30829 [Lupinus angustifolius]
MMELMMLKMNIFTCILNGILVYEYLLFHGESYLAAGGEQVFKILGPVIFGVSALDILGALPESLILLVTRLNSDKGSAQEYASPRVGLLAGSSILLLTVVWGTCGNIGSQKLKDDPKSVGSNSSNSSNGRIKESLTSFGIIMDIQTVKISRMMVFSVIQLIIMQIPIKRVVPWLIGSLTEDETKMFLRNMQLAASTSDSAPVILFCGWACKAHNEGLCLSSSASGCCPPQRLPDIEENIVQPSCSCAASSGRGCLELSESNGKKRSVKINILKLDNK